MQNEIAASIVGFAGFLFLCSWRKPVGELLPIRAQKFTAEAATLHPSEVEISGTNVWIRFDWSDAYRNDTDEGLAKLRSKYASPPR